MAPEVTGHEYKVLSKEENMQDSKQQDVICNEY